jgi:hypothetical protein
MIAGHADTQRDRDQRLTEQETIHHPPVKCPARQQRTGAMLEHGVRVRFRREFSSFQTRRRACGSRKPVEQNQAIARFMLRCHSRGNV